MPKKVVELVAVQLEGSKPSALTIIADTAADIVPTSALAAIYSVPSRQCLVTLTEAETARWFRLGGSLFIGVSAEMEASQILVRDINPDGGAMLRRALSRG